MATIPVTDLSQRVVSIAREIDRLPAGDYSIHIVKPVSRHDSWQVKIDTTLTVREMDIPAKIIQTNEHGLKQENGVQL